MNISADLHLVDWIGIDILVTIENRPGALKETVILIQISVRGRRQNLFFNVMLSTYIFESPWVLPPPLLGTKIALKRSKMNQQIESPLLYISRTRGLKNMYWLTLSRVRSINEEITCVHILPQRTGSPNFLQNVNVSRERCLVKHSMFLPLQNQLSQRFWSFKTLMIFGQKMTESLWVTDVKPSDSSISNFWHDHSTLKCMWFLFFKSSDEFSSEAFILLKHILHFLRFSHCWDYSDNANRASTKRIVGIDSHWIHNHSCWTQKDQPTHKVMYHWIPVKGG